MTRAASTPPPTASNPPASLPPVPVDAVGAFVGEPALLAPGVPGGPLAGVRVGVKDALDVAGTVTGAGNPAFAAVRDPAVDHAVAVQRLVDAGASVVGKTVLDELAYSLAGRNAHLGAPVNAAAPGHLAGGSSSGSAAAVAAGLVELGVGTDTGGSIRVPASCCGLFGWRPTHGAVDVGGVVPLAPSFDTVGLLAADPILLRIGAEALLPAPAASTEAGGSAGERSTHPHRLRSVVRWVEAFSAVDPSVADAIARHLEPGIETVDVGIDVGLDLPAAAEAFRILQAREAWVAHGAWITASEPDFAPDVAARFTAASEVTDDQVVRARAVQADVRARLDHALADGTVLALPAAAGPPPPVDVSPDGLDAFRLATMQLTAPAGLAGLPVVVIPGARVDGLPVGLALVGARGADRGLIDLATRVGVR